MESVVSSEDRLEIGRPLNCEWFARVATDIQEALPNFVFIQRVHPALIYARFFELSTLAIADGNRFAYLTERAHLLCDEYDFLEEDMRGLGTARRRVKRDPNKDDVFNLQVHLYDFRNRAGGWRLEGEKGLVRNSFGLEHKPRPSRRKEVLHIVDLGDVIANGPDDREVVRDSLKDVNMRRPSFSSLGVIHQ